MATLASAADLATILGIDATDPAVVLAIRRASDRFEGEIGYPLELVAVDDLVVSGAGSRVLLLPARPVVGDPVVKVAGVILAADVDYGIKRNPAVLVWLGPGGWPAGEDNIEITYSHGYNPIPGDVADAVLEMAEIDSRPHGVTAVASGSESISLASTGVTQRWVDVVEKYRLKDGRD